MTAGTRKPEKNVLRLDEGLFARERHAMLLFFGTHPTTEKRERKKEPHKRPKLHTRVAAYGANATREEEATSSNLKSCNASMRQVPHGGVNYSANLVGQPPRHMRLARIDPSVDCLSTCLSTSISRATLSPNMPADS